MLGHIAKNETSATDVKSYLVADTPQLHVVFFFPRTELFLREVVEIDRVVAAIRHQQVLLLREAHGTQPDLVIPRRVEKKHVFRQQT